MENIPIQILTNCQGYPSKQSNRDPKPTKTITKSTVVDILPLLPPEIPDHLSRMGVDQSQVTTNQKKNSIAPQQSSKRTTFSGSLCDSTPLGGVGSQKIRRGCYPKDLYSSAPVQSKHEQVAEVSSTSAASPLGCYEIGNHMSLSDREHSEAYFCQKWQPLLMHASLPHFPGPQQLKDFKCRQTSSVELPDSSQNNPEKFTQKSKDSEVSAPRDLESSVSQLSGYRHVYTVRPPSFTENAGMLTYLQCSQTLDDFFITQLKMKAKTDSQSSSKEQAESFGGRGFKKE